MATVPIVPPAAGDPLHHKLERARQDLLDLGLRNTLINYRPLRSRGVEVVDERSAHIFNLLVRERKALAFKPIDPDADFDEASWVEDDATGEQHTDLWLQTGESEERLAHRLLQSFYFARTLLEEQGVSVLFLALGMLRWYEDAASQTPRRAPLILVPVELERRNALDRFQLRYTDEELGENLSLRAKLKQEFNIDAPAFPAEQEDFDVGGYLDAFSAAIGAQGRWAVEHDAIALGFFSFGKFLMYRDLDPTVWPDGLQPAAHELVGPLLGDGFAGGPSEYGDDTFIDAVLGPDDLRQVVDADSSQTLAILDVRSGRNLVIQGPPGTGKSQTITNLIAEAIGAGQQVLFVAEKMAALEVVKRRLDNIGLGDACLELHSHKINKRGVIQELARTLSLGRPRAAQLDAQLGLLTEQRNRLNAYCFAVNVPIGESELSPHQAYGALLESAAVPGSDGWPRLEGLAPAQWPAPEYRRKLAVVEELQARVNAMGVPVAHPFWGAGKQLILPSDREQGPRQIAAAAQALVALRSTAGVTAGLLQLSAPMTLSEVARLATAAHRLATLPQLPGFVPAAPEWQSRRAEVDELLAAGTSYADLRRRHAEAVIPAVWEADLLQPRQDLAAYREKWWRFLSGRYRSAKSALAGYCSAGLPDGVDAQIGLLDDILEAQRLAALIEQRADLGTRLFGASWRGAQSDWLALHAAGAWAMTLHADVAAGALPAGVLGALSLPFDAGAVLAAGGDLEQRAAEFRTARDPLFSRLEFDAGQRFGVVADEVPFADLAALLEAWAVRFDELSEMTAFNSSVAACLEQQLDEVVAVAERWPEAGTALTAAFQRAWYMALLERAMRERSALGQFDGPVHEQVIERFKQLDQLTFERNRLTLAQAHWTRLPRQEGGGQLAVLRREMEKRARHLPVRQLMDRAGAAVQAIKPVFMMSPMSVATFIPPGALEFDLVIFDEASQVKPVDAFGAMLRGQQAVVVGDSKQLPPTSFFDTLTHGEEAEEDESVTSDIESILGLMSASNAPQRMLRWHYRSRHESLIAVSNHEFYENRLVIFPSPDHSRERLGLVLHHLPDTVYGRGGSRTNPGEADVVAAAVLRHARSSPDRTLGVAAFSQPQAEAIITRVEALRREDPSCEAFFAAHPHEPFFVKNLENVQGDERDVIYISVGYGRDAGGYVSMNFGPLNGSGGERRLNVLITRARLRCEVFTNLTADDLDLSRTGSRGVLALKRFLRYAATGILDVPRATGRAADSPFEESVAAALRSAGYEVVPQVGSAGFFIDLAIVDSERPGRYLLGIECDGASYHSARSARDRDRLRQQVLEGLGWKIHRVWSTDWFRHQERELRRLVTAIEHAKAAGVERAEPASSAASATVIDRISTPPIPAPPQVSGNAEVLARLRAVATGSQATHAGAAPAPPASQYVLATPSLRVQVSEVHEMPLGEAARLVQEVVEVESPVHISEVIRRVTEGTGAARAGNRIRSTILAGVTRQERSGALRREGDFLWMPALADAPVRDRSQLPGQYKQLSLIAPQEIEQALLLVIAGGFGMQRDEAIDRAARLLGFQRVTAGMEMAVGAAVDNLLAAGRLETRNGQLFVVEG